MPASNSLPLSFFKLYDKFIADSRKGKRLQPNGKRISPGTIDNYHYTKQLIIGFCEQKKFELRIWPLRKLNARKLITERNYWKNFYRKFTDYLYNDKGYFDNYVGVSIKNIRTFFNYLNKELALGIGDFHKLFYVRKEEIAIFPLLPEELNFLIKDEAFTTSLSPRMREVKDFFVFGCTVALRFSDLKNLTATNLRMANDRCYLIVRSKKTATDSLVRLPDYAVDIIRRYRTPKHKLLPSFNVVNLNKYIKLLLEQAGFTQPVMINRNKRGNAVMMKSSTRHSSIRFCDVATTHTMRRTAITTMLSLGMPEQVVRKISGHSPAGKEFYRYVSWAQSYQDQATDKMFAALENKTIRSN